MKKSKYRIKRVFFNPYRMTLGQLKELFIKGGYYLLRYPDGFVLAVNAKIGLLAEKRKKHYNPNMRSSFCSYRKCNISEYVSKKHTDYGIR